ncbi:MAG: hypothetical protein RLZ98_75 [Pseudomonadota bacterium]|jgi:predicted alpha/beta-hydrolase family hydrolase
MQALEISGPLDAPLVLLAHGAGAGSKSGFMVAIADALETQGVATGRFDFAYMAMSQSDGRRRPPPRMAVIMEEMRARIAEAHALAGDRPLFIGGKSMGGRIASMIAAESPAESKIAGCICLAYPFHPAGKPDLLRTSHLAETTCPTLIVQGTRDALGNCHEVAGYKLSGSIELAWLEDGDHDFKPRKSSGHTHADHFRHAAAAVADFVRRHTKS